MLVSIEPRNTEMMAGGASLAPRRCSLPDVAIPARSNPWCLYTPLRTAARNRRKRRFWCGVLPGLSRLTPSRSLSAVSYTHLRAHETRHDLVCRLLLEKK